MGALRVENLPSYTYEDYKLWDGEWELIDGIAYAMAPAPLFSHQAIAYEISRRFGNELENCDKCIVLGESDYKVNSYTVLKPDIVIVCEKFDVNITKPPKLIVEVISPSTARNDEILKFDIYEKEGVGYYIMVYPQDKMVKVYKNSKDGYKKIYSDDDIYEFEINGCKAKVDFKAAFKRVL